MAKMKEYMCHVKDERTSNIEKRVVYFCGESAIGFAFTGVGHLVAERQCKGRLLPCPECKRIIIDLLNNEE